MTETITVETTVHGRALLRRSEGTRWLVGFHGYAETAELHLAELEQIEEAATWNLAAVQALHPFYTKNGEKVVASWMTSLDRELAAADNVRYVRSVVELLAPTEVVFAGFSQGAAMAYRAAAAIPSSGLIILGGDVPPDVMSGSRFPPVLLGRGSGDGWYTAEKLKKDLSFLEGVTSVELVEFEGGHAWHSTFREAASAFLKRR